MDKGKLSVLHEEVLRGIHILSVGAVPPGAELLVELEQTVPLADIGGVPFLRLPMTTGHLYGTSPLLPSDDLVIADVRYFAALSVTVDVGRAILQGQTLAPEQTLEIVLDRAVELRIEGGSFGKLAGIAADGRFVSLTLDQLVAGEAPLDLHVIVDRSGSTNSSVRDGTASIWQAMRDGLAAELASMRATDRVTLWQFDSECKLLGAARGPACAKLVEKLEGPRGGTELSGAIRAALEKGARDVLVLTDGQTWAHMVEELKGEAPRISAILAGPSSLDANIGHLCALTGGQVLYAPGRDVGSALRSAFAALRQVGSSVQGQVTELGPTKLTAIRGGVRLIAEWSAEEQVETADRLAIGRFTAALALPLLPAEQAEAFARAHSLCTHMTSLVLVDDAGEATEGLSQMRKVPLMASMSSERAIVHSMPPVMYPLDRAAFSAPRPRIMSASAPTTKALAHFQASTMARTPRFGIGLNKQHAAQQVTSKVPTQNLAQRTLDWLRRRGNGSNVTPFDDFPWDAHGDALLAGDLQMLSSEQMAVVERLAQRVHAAKLTKGNLVGSIGDERIIALGLIAERSKDRVAKRFARRALKNAPPWIMAII